MLKITLLSFTPSFLNMATAWQASQIKGIKNICLNVNRTQITYTIITFDNNDMNLEETEFDTDSLNSPAFSKIIQAIPGMPSTINSHNELLKFMKLHFSDKREVEMDIEINNRIGQSYCSFTLKPFYITGIPVKCIISAAVKYYQSGHIVIDQKLVSNQSDVNFCLHICYLISVHTLYVIKYKTCKLAIICILYYI